MLSGKIDGFYKIEKLQFGNYKDKDGNTQPCLKFKLGEYINIGKLGIPFMTGCAQEKLFL